ncbi:hypothetical protein ACFWIJ_41300, partial [Streptomyces sp. NPDC127079]|uniref:hypothetical protein n=1 Tax=Streptomyces sp. NPDC127079 TaxID=3347132 RepID=UPI00365A7D48
MRLTSDFQHRTFAQHVSFSTGRGVRDLADAVTRTGAGRALLNASRSSAAWADAATEGLPVAHRFGEETQLQVPAGLPRRARPPAATDGGREPHAG